MNFKTVPNTGDKLKDIESVVEDFWKDKHDATQASERELIDFVITITAINDREVRGE